MKSDNITKNVAHRRYGDACGAAHALELIGDRWALLVMREMMFGPRRFGDLRASLPGISANTLTQRLEGLITSGIARRERLPPPASTPVYALTEWGLESEPILGVLGRWAVRSPQHDPTLAFSAASLLLSLRTMIAPDRAGSLYAKIGFRMAGETYCASIVDGVFAAERAPVEDCDIVLEGDPPTIAAWIYGGVPLDDLETAGALRITGDRSLVAIFPELFPLPAKAQS